MSVIAHRSQHFTLNRLEAPTATASSALSEIRRALLASGLTELPRRQKARWFDYEYERSE
jgi:hypothetical protein